MSEPTKDSIDKQITATLVRLAKAKIRHGDDNKLQTRASIVAALIWERALGYTQIDPNSGKSKIMPPATWAINLILERMEGKVGPQDEAKRKATPVNEKISILNKELINRLSEE